MDTWTCQAGFPVVSAVRNGTKLTLKQRRFFPTQILIHQMTHLHIITNGKYQSLIPLQTIILYTSFCHPKTRIQVSILCSVEYFN